MPALRPSSRGPEAADSILAPSIDLRGYAYPRKWRDPRRRYPLGQPRRKRRARRLAACFDWGEGTYVPSGTSFPSFTITLPSASTVARRSGTNQPPATGPFSPPRS